MEPPPPSASPGRRVLAGTVDAAVVAVPVLLGTALLAWLVGSAVRGLARDLLAATGGERLLGELVGGLPEWVVDLGIDRGIDAGTGLVVDAVVGFLVGAVLLAALAALALLALALLLGARSPGKRLLGLDVLGRDGAPAGRGTALVRALAQGVPLALGVIVLSALIGPFAAALVLVWYAPAAVGLPAPHDLLCGTRVVRR